MTDTLPRVLIVEDNVPLRDLLRDVLGGRGFDVFAAGTATEALEIIACYSIDVVLSDWELPQVSGLDLCRSLRKQGLAFGSMVPVWLMTGSDDPALVKQALAAGAFGVLRKPFRLDTAAACVERAIGATVRPRQPAGNSVTVPAR